MQAFELRATLISILGPKWLPSRAAAALGHSTRSVRTWLDGAAPVPLDVELTVRQIAAMEPTGRPIAWLHWDCRIDLHQAYADQLARNAAKREIERARAFTLAEMVELHARARSRMRSQLTR